MESGGEFVFCYYMFFLFVTEESNVRLRELTRRARKNKGLGDDKNRRLGFGRGPYKRAGLSPLLFLFFSLS